MKQKHVMKKAIFIGGSLSVLTACSIFPSQETSSIDPPQIINESPSPIISDDLQSTQLQETRLQTVFVQDERGYLAPISLSIPKTASPAKTVLGYMVAEGPASKLLPPGFQAVLPKGTEVRGISISPENKIATVDFTQSFTSYEAKDERKILEAVTWTLTSFPTIDRVQFRVEGKPLKEMPHTKTPVDVAWSRAMGINLEKEEGISYNQSTPVTLYFVNQNQNHFKYYVPVTRFIKPTEEVAQAVVAQLIQGPTPASGLKPVMHPDIELKKIHLTPHLITVNFNEQFLGPNQQVSDDALHTLVLSLSENTGIEQIQFQVEGQKEVYSQSKSRVDQPVTRPKHLNPLSL